ncbi:MAG: hypothetical protein IPH34_07630 [Chitinophagaceae bacterium]|nr:hypothetical protein [Chitinophagaceae bacterium]HOZ98366.1 hypothetical protein [Niabella sp.]MBK8311918.1 hypothetical protein [Chitinophagaceae bacterium]MBK8608098.1 hypothetical protein [Chitinophagaceae bacterium]MBP6478950.1 hypothetical protein [Chitinophagaceae bacterium]
MKTILFIIFFVYSSTLFCQNKHPYNFQNKRQGTYLIKTDNNVQISEDSATLFIRIFGLSRSGCQELDKGAIFLGKDSISLQENTDIEFLLGKFIPIEVKPGSYKVTIKSPYSFYTPLKTKKLKFKKGYSYSISFFLVRTYSSEE